MVTTSDSGVVGGEAGGVDSFGSIQCAAMAAGTTTPDATKISFESADCEGLGVRCAKS